MGSVAEVPKLQSFPDGTPMETIFEALYRDGAVVIKNVVSAEAIADINQDLKPHMEADYNSGLDVFAKQTKTVCGLAGKSPAAVKAILQNKTIMATVREVLTVTTSSYWGDALNTCVSPPLLSSMFAVRVGPGSARQGLHRDDQDHHATHRNQDPKETTKLGCFLALTKVTRENGATEIVPRSNIWDDVRKPHISEVTYGEMDPGDACLCVGNTYHGAGGNVTADDFRSVIVTLFCKGMYRAEENQFLAVDRETVKKMDHDVQDLLGWKASAPFCGWHEFGDPSRLIRENNDVARDLF